MLTHLSLMKVNFSYKILTSILLVLVIIVNSGYGIYEPGDPTGSIEICDHCDHESEGEDKENGETDDIFKHDSRDLYLNAINSGNTGLFSILGFPSNHLETITPPPECKHCC